MTNHFPVLDSDREIFERELDSFLPDRIYDAHCHLWERSQFPGGKPALIDQGPESVGFAVYKTSMEELTPGRRYSGLFFGFPHAEADIDAANDFLAREVEADPDSHAQMLIRPGMDPEFVRETVRRDGFVGLVKPRPGRPL